MSYSKVYIHFVWVTKMRKPFLVKDKRIEIQKHILANSREKGIFVETINGYLDHLHCLVSLGKDQTISEVARLIKGESSFWINKQQLFSSKFAWQEEYYAVSVSESVRRKVIEYIENQEDHHSRKTFMEEHEELIAVLGRDS